MNKNIFILFYFLAYSYAQLLITNSGPCTCDITSNYCDNNCCCDTNCTSIEKQSFYCPNDQISPQLYGCFPTELLFQNNTAYLNMTLNNQYCVYQDNYTTRNFYVSPRILDVLKITSPNDMPVLATAFNAFDGFKSSVYTIGMNIYSVSAGNSVGILSISRPSNGGTCVDGLPIEYLVNEVVTCNRVITSVSTSCASLPGVSNYYAQNMVIPAHPSVMTSVFTSTQNIAASTYFAAVTCIGCNSSLTPTYNSSSGFCDNVVSQVKYEVFGESNITSVVITMTLGNFNTDFSQTFNVSFTKSGYSSSAAKYSGNPGYIQGYPVKSIATDGSIQNMAMITGGSCNSKTSSAILFGTNSFSDCSVSGLNTAAAINSHVVTSLSPYLHPFLAAYGNMSTANQVPLTIHDDTSSSNTLTISKLTVYIIFARTGTLTLPQNTIIGYQSTYSYADVTSFGQQYWVSVVVKFVDHSQTVFDITSQIARLSAGNTVRDFLYLLYVENGAATVRCLGNIVVVLVLVLVARLWALV